MAQPAKKESLGLTTDLAKKLIKAFPQYKGLSEQDFLDMLDKISAVETQDKNIYQLKGGPGRGYYQMELESAPVAYDRALNIQKELKARGIDLPKLPRYNQDFTKLTKDEQAFYTLTKMVGAAGAKRLQGKKDYYLNPKDPKKMWLELHWAGKDVDKPARIKHWEETHGKEALVPQKIKTLKQEITKPTLQPSPQPSPQVKKVQTQVKQEIEQPDLHPAGPEKTTLSAPPMLSDKRVKQLANAKFVPNPIGIPIFTEKGTFVWDKPAGELDIMLHGRPGPTVRRAQAMENAEAVQPPTYAQGGPIYNWIPPNYPRVGARNKQGGWLEKYADGGDVPHDYMYSQGNVSSYRPGTSIHPIGMTNVPDSPCGPGFTIQYDETGNPVCMPIAELAPSAPTAPTPVLAGANQRDYDLFNPAVYKQSPLVTYSVEKTARGRNKEERFKPTKEERQATRKAIKASSLHRRPFLSGIGQFFRDVKERCFGEKCYKFENGSWVADSSIPTPTTPSYYPAGPDRTLTNYQMGTPKAPMYAHGATVWNKRLADEQMSAAYVVSPDTKGTQVKNTYPDRMSGAENPTNYKIGDYIPTGMDYKSPAAGTYDYNKDVQPYYKMRLHAPDTRRMAYGGYVPKYGFGSTIADIGKLALNTVAAPMEQVTGNNFVNFNYANKGIADAAAVSEGILGAAADVAGTALLGPAYGMGKGMLQNVTKSVGTSTEEQRGANKWANKTGQIVGSTGDLIAGIASGNPQQIVGGAGNLLGTAGGQLGSKELGMVGQLAGLSSSFINPAASTNSFGKVPQLGGTGDLISGSGMLMAKHGGRIPGLRWHQLNLGVSAPEGIYTKPTNQRGVTFADGGDTSNSVRESTYVQPVYKDRIIDQNNPVEVANSLLKKYNVKVDSTSNVLKDIGLPSEGYYNPITRTIHYKNPNVFNNLTPEEREYFQTSRYVNMIGAEIPHAIQSDSLGVLPFLGKIAYEGIQNPTHSRYDTEGTLEHHAHQILEPKIRNKIYNSRTFSPTIERMRRSSVQPSKKKNGGWLDSYEDGGEVDITKPYLNPATVQATLARAQQPVTNTLGRVISTPASREKERREKIITNDQSKYSVEDYKKGIQEPGAGNSVLDDPLAMAAALTAGGVGLGATALSQIPRVFARNLASETTMGLSDLTKAGIQSAKPVINTAKNLEDLKAAQEFAQQYGYNLPTNVERIAQSDMLTDKVIRGMMDRHNTFVRGVSTNWNEIEKRNPEILRHLEGKGFDLSTKEGTKAAAEYMATHIPISTGYGRASLNRDIFDQGLEGLYTSNSIPTAEGYTYGQGFITKAKKPTNYSSSNRQDWITQNNPQYYEHNLPSHNTLMIDGKITHPINLNTSYLYNIENYDNINAFKDKVLKDLEKQAASLKEIFEKKASTNPTYSQNMKNSYDEIVKRIEDIKAQKWENTDVKFDKNLLKTEHINVLSDSELGINSPDISLTKFYDTVIPKLGLNVSENAQLRDELHEMAFNLRKQYGASLSSKRILEEAQKLVKDKYTNRYAHYIHLGTPGEKVLEPIKSWEITPEIWKNKSRGHTNKYTKKLSAMENGGIVSSNKYKQGGWLDNL